MLNTLSLKSPILPLLPRRREEEARTGRHPQQPYSDMELVHLVYISNHSAKVTSVNVEKKRGTGITDLKKVTPKSQFTGTFNPGDLDYLCSYD